ncbi:SDR family oxidoreductase [Xanthomonas campestris pv. campestris]|nr:SDR family oxidoreductase [Xanthomonas campestris pv. campestris]
MFANPAAVVLNTSINAHVGAARSSVYAATKAAFLSIAKTLSSELLGCGIRLNAVSPGPVEIPLYDKLGIPNAYRDQVNQDIAATIRSAASAPRTKWPRPCCTSLAMNRNGRWARNASSTAAARSTGECLEGSTFTGDDRRQ